MKQFKLDIVLPSNNLYEGDAESLRIITHGGPIEVLAKHQAIVTALQAGIARVEIGSLSKQFFLNGGILEVDNHGNTSITSVQGFEIPGDSFDFKNLWDQYKNRKEDLQKAIAEALTGAIEFQPTENMSYLFLEERLAKFEVFREMMSGK